MKTFKEENRELLLWYKEEALKAREQDNIDWTGGLDGNVNSQRVFREYRRRVEELQRKHNIPITPR